MEIDLCYIKRNLKYFAYRENHFHMVSESCARSCESSALENEVYTLIYVNKN